MNRILVLDPESQTSRPIESLLSLLNEAEGFDPVSIPDLTNLPELASTASALLCIYERHSEALASRSIPVVIVYDEDFNEIGWWGPRPGEIQSWVMSEGLALPSPERYKHVRRWYARDRGRTTLTELLDIFQKAA